MPIKFKYRFFPDLEREKLGFEPVNMIFFINERKKSVSL